MSRPRRISRHALDRYFERWVEIKGHPLWPAHMERRVHEQDLLLKMATSTLHHTSKGLGDNTVWKAADGMLFVVAVNGTVITILPKGAQTPTQVPQKHRRHRRRPRRHG